MAKLKMQSNQDADIRLIESYKQMSKNGMNAAKAGEKLAKLANEMSKFGATAEEAEKAFKLMSKL